MPLLRQTILLAAFPKVILSVFDQIRQEDIFPEGMANPERRALRKT